MFLLLVIACLCLWCIFENYKHKIDNRPPGPLKLPLIGNIPCMLPAILNLSKIKAHFKFNLNFLEAYDTFKPTYIVFHQLSEKYGPLMTFQFGVNNAVVVSSGELAKEVFCREEFPNRFADGWLLERQFGKPLGLIFNNGKPYRSVKQFTMKHLKEFGLGKKENMEIALEDELQDFINDLQSKISISGSLVNTHHMFTVPVLNILWCMVAGVKFSYNDNKVHELNGIVEEISKGHDFGGNILMAYPWLRFIAPELTGHGRQMRLYGKLRQFFKDILQARLNEGLYDTESPRDFVDVFLQGINKNRNNSEKLDMHTIFTDEEFIMISLDLFTAGSETTSNTLEFAILYTMLHPEIQRKVQDEIDTVVGPNRLPNINDKQQMPYTEATILEVQRMCNVIPLVHRVATSDTTLGSYRIRKNDVVVVNLHSVHKNERDWVDPHEFLPERFLDENGLVKNIPYFQPFGMGKRTCMGELLAKQTLFTYFTSLLQRYSIMLPAGDPPNFKPSSGFTLSPNPFIAFIKPRSSET